jgi:thiol-disulfide isomerase/thioredoxin
MTCISASHAPALTAAGAADVTTRRSRARATAFACALALLLASTFAPRIVTAHESHGATASEDSPADLIGKPARAWTFTRWVGTEPLTLEGLRGKVVLVRWFSPGCPYCQNTLPSLEKLRKRYASQGLVVVGVYHPKPVREVSDKAVREAARKLGFGGPLALDQDWTTLNRWWLMNHPDRHWTSVSFLIDRQGIVRWGQGGGEYHPSSDPAHAACDARHAELERTIQQLLAVTSAAR